MAICSLACRYDRHVDCLRPDQHCECKCHPWNTPNPRTSLLAQTREDAHQAVKAFDRKPDHANTKAAMDALSLYLGLLSQGYDQTPKTREEQAAFATAWDAKVEAGRG